MERLYTKLVNNLEELTKNYRQLLELVRNERELLLKADLPALLESNQNKELILYKLKTLDQARLRIAKEFANEIGADSQNPRLLDLAQHVSLDEEAERLRQIHSALDLLIRRIAEVNRDNETFAKTALQTLNGAVNELKDTLSGKKGYGQNGQKTRGVESAGNLVSKEA